MNSAQSASARCRYICNSHVASFPVEAYRIRHMSERGHGWRRRSAVQAGHSLHPEVVLHETYISLAKERPQTRTWSGNPHVNRWAIDFQYMFKCFDTTLPAQSNVRICRSLLTVLASRGIDPGVDSTHLTGYRSRMDVCLGSLPSTQAASIQLGAIDSLTGPVTLKIKSSIMTEVRNGRKSITTTSNHNPTTLYGQTEKWAGVTIRIRSGLQNKRDVLLGRDTPGKAVRHLPSWDPDANFLTIFTTDLCQMVRRFLLITTNQT